MKKNYEYALAITSQFPFCSIPLRLDSYSRCQFACRYCFAAARGGAAASKNIKLAQPDALARRLDRLANGASPRSVLDEMLAARIPIHFGGLSDPFMPMELQEEVTLRLLEILKDHKYPTVISTKSQICAATRYLNILSSGNFIVQMSLPGLSSDLAARVDAGVPSPTDRLKAVKALSAENVSVACRLQPLLEFGSRAKDLIAACADAGARQVAVEHLKLAVDNSQHRQALSLAMGLDLVSYYQERKAKRVGREWVLPVADRIERILDLKISAHASGLLFGAADNDLLHLSDGTSCCSSVDQLGFSTAYRFTFTQAIHGHRNGNIAFSNIDNEWRPKRSISRYVNSRSRIIKGSIEDYIKLHWNGFRHGSGLDSYYGVNRSGECDENGFEIYKMNNDLMSIL